MEAIDRMMADRTSEMRAEMLAGRASDLAEMRALKAEWASERASLRERVAELDRTCQCAHNHLGAAPGPADSSIDLQGSSILLHEGMPKNRKNDTSTGAAAAAAAAAAADALPPPSSTENSEAAVQAQLNSLDATTTILLARVGGYQPLRLCTRWRSVYTPDLASSRAASN